MPVILVDQDSDAENSRKLPFPPVLKSHILHCSYHYWHPKYRTITPKARVIPLTKPFLDYLRADGIILPSDNDDIEPEWSDKDSGVYSASDNTDDSEADDEDEDVASGWREIHQAIKNTIAELGGQVMPKLNWSAPKDATWMNANTMVCSNPDDVYLLLKSSDFVTHDLEHPFDDCHDSPDSRLTTDDIPYCLALRKYVPKFNPSLEFRCFVRERKLLCLCQRDLNHFDFLFNMQDRLRSLIKEFFEVRLRDSFPDESFCFDVYVPPPYDRVWLVDFNPWAPRTDPLLFSWMELLSMPDPPEGESSDSEPDDIVRLSLNDGPHGRSLSAADIGNGDDALGDEEFDLDGDQDDEIDEEFWLPEMRLIRKTDPEAYSFSTPQYSAHKLPKDVVDASQSGEGLREFAQNWQQILAQRRKEDEAAESSEGE